METNPPAKLPDDLYENASVLLAQIAREIVFELTDMGMKMNIRKGK